MLRERKVPPAVRHLAPEAPDRLFGLPFFVKPVEHGDAIQILPPPMLATEGHQTARDGEFVTYTQTPQFPKASRKVKRRWQFPGRQHGRLPAGFDEVKLLVEMDSVRNIQALIEVHDVDATSQNQMLAIVDDF
jgi:hypothetical protein